MSDRFDPKRTRDVLESIARQIPGFAGYLDKAERRESDAQARRWLADRLAASKPSLDAFTRSLTERGQLDRLAACGRLRDKIELLISRLRGAAAGYRSFWDANQVDEDRLEDILDHDLWLLEHAEKTAVAIERLGGGDGDLESAEKLLRELEQRFGDRTKLLSGEEPGA